MIDYDKSTGISFEGLFLSLSAILKAFSWFRPPVLPQVGPAHGPGRHQRRCEGLPQVRHQRHHQGGRGQDPAQE